MLSTDDVSLGNVDSSLFLIQTKILFVMGHLSNMGKTAGIFLNLQCDCHIVSSIFLETDQSPYQFQQLAAIFDSAMN